MMVLSVDLYTAVMPAAPPEEKGVREYSIRGMG
jgi:hypothetical protein